jgi:hypothetical protein
MAGAVQTVVAQKAVEIGFGRIRGGSFTGFREKFLSGLPVENPAQFSGGGVQEGVIVEEKVRSLKSHIIHPAEPLNGLTDMGGKGGKQKLSEPVMGITCGHKNHLG